MQVDDVNPQEALREVIALQPLDAQLGQWPKRSVPAEALDALPGPGGQVFALLDAGRIAGLVEQLEAAGLPHLSLFKGPAEAGYRDVAPYLVRIGSEDPLLRRLFTRSGRGSDLWDAAAGILLRSGSPAEALRDHLRHFTRMQDEAGAWFYFRFWDPATANRYLGTLLAQPDRYDRWFRTPEARIDAFLIPQPGPDRLIVYRPLDRPAAAPGRPRLAGADRDALRLARTEQDLAQIAALMRQTFPERSGRLGAADLDRAVRRSAGRAREFDIRQRANVFRLAAWDLYSDGPFEHADPDGRLRQILERDLPEADKMDRLAARMAELDGES